MSVVQRIARCSMVFIGFSYFAACGSSGEKTTGPNPGPTTPAAVATVTVTPGTLPLIIGQSSQLSATTRDADSHTLTGRDVTWKSSNTDIANVSTTGVVSAAAPGNATITATSEGKNGTAEVSVTAIPIVSFTTVATGGAHTCALAADGAAYCWGRDEAGQLGVAPPSTLCVLDGPSLPCILIPTRVQGGLTFTRLTAGGAHTCALTSDGTAYCWGTNTDGQLGDNSGISRDHPVAVAGQLKFSSIDAGLNHTCGLTSDGSAYCWGSNNRGQIGDGTTTSRLAPVTVAGGLTFQMITAGGYARGHTCAVAKDGSAYCWGDNDSGQLGIDGGSDLVSHPTPALVSGSTKYVAASAGLGFHTCALTAEGNTYCWGLNDFGALGNGSSVRSTVPVFVLGGVAFKQLAAGGFIGHTCALAVNNSAYCWGENSVGAIGDGTLIDRLTPAVVAGGLSWTIIDSGFRHSCGRATNGALYCWGSGRTGQLGANSVTERNAPVKVLGQP